MEGFAKAMLYCRRQNGSKPSREVRNDRKKNNKIEKKRF